MNVLQYLRDGGSETLTFVVGRNDDAVGGLRHDKVKRVLIV